MTKTQGVAALTKLYGKNAMWRLSTKAPTAAERAAAQGKLPELVAAKNAAKEAIDRRRAELLLDPEYIRLRDEFQAAEKSYAETSQITRWFRVVVGRFTGFAFHVTGQGDNWADAISEAKKSRQ